MEGTRLLELQKDVCGLDIFNTKYNEIPEIPPYLGILFSVKSRGQPLEILTLELDLRLEDDSDTSIEVYTFDGLFTTIFSDASRWKQVANTKVVRNPQGAGAGALIPAADFDTITMGPNERKSFYITMKSPLIDFNANAFKKTGELAIENDDLSVYVGSGLTEYKFPSEVDTLLDPQFAGVIHYKRTLEACDMQDITTVTYHFLLRDPADVNVLDIVAARTDQQINDLLRNDQNLIEIQTVHELAKMVDATAYPVEYYGQCPDFWLQCYAVYSVVRFQHLRTLSSGSLLYQMYQNTNVIENAMKETIGRNNIVYIGYQDVAVDFELTLKGVPAGVTMDLVQQKHFSDTSEGFLGDGIYTGAQVLEVQILEQFPLQSRRELQHLSEDRQLQDTNGRLRIAGTILGAQVAYYSSEAFAHTLEKTIRSSQEELLTSLSFRALLPGDVAEEGRPLFFSGISSVEGTFAAVLPPNTPAPTQEPTAVEDTVVIDSIGSNDGSGSNDEKVDIWIWILVGATVAIFIGIFILVCHRRRIKAKREEKKLKKMRRIGERNIRQQQKMSYEEQLAKAGAKGEPESAPQKRLNQEVPLANDAVCEKNQSRVGNHSIAKGTREPNERDGVKRSSTSHVARQSGRGDSNLGRTNGIASKLSKQQLTEEPLKGPAAGQGGSLNEPRAVPLKKYMTEQQSFARPRPVSDSRSVQLHTPDRHKANAKPTKEFEDLPLRRAPTPSRSFDSSVKSSRSDAAQGSTAASLAARSPPPRQKRSKSFDGMLDSPPIRRTPGSSRSLFDRRTSDRKLAPSSDRDYSIVERRNGPASTPSQQQSLLGPLMDPEASQGAALHDPRTLPLEEYMTRQQNSATPQHGSESTSVQLRTPDHHEANAKPTKEFEDTAPRKAPPPSRSFDSSVRSSRSDAAQGSRAVSLPASSPPSRAKRSKSFDGVLDSRSFDGHMVLAPSSNRRNSNAGRTNSPASSSSPPPSQQQSLDGPLRGPEAGQGGYLHEPRATGMPSANEFEVLPLRRIPPPSRSFDSSVRSSRSDATQGSRAVSLPASPPPSRPKRKKSFDGVLDSRSFDGYMVLAPSSSKRNSNAGCTNNPASPSNSAPIQQQSLDGRLNGSVPGQGSALHDRRAMPLAKYMTGQQSSATTQPGSESRSVSFHTQESHEAIAKPTTEFEDLPLRRAPMPDQLFDSSVTPNRSWKRPQAARSTPSRPSLNKSFDGVTGRPTSNQQLRHIPSGSDRRSDDVPPRQPLGRDRPFEVRLSSETTRHSPPGPDQSLDERLGKRPIRRPPGRISSVI